MTSFFDLYLYTKTAAYEHPLIAAVLLLISAAFLLPPVALAAFLSSPVLFPVALLLLVRQYALLCGTYDAVITAQHMAHIHRLLVIQARRLLHRQPPGQQAIAGASKKPEHAPTGDTAFAWLSLFLCCIVTQCSTQSTRCTHQLSSHFSLTWYI